MMSTPNSKTSVDQHKKITYEKTNEERHSVVLAIRNTTSTEPEDERNDEEHDSLREREDQVREKRRTVRAFQWFLE